MEIVETTTASAVFLPGDLWDSKLFTGIWESAAPRERA